MLAECQATAGCFLKIDIEGSEYEILDQVIEKHDVISAIAIEFHRVPKESNFDTLLDRLLESFDITHVHANSAGGMDESGFPNLLEITFVNKQIFSGTKHVGDTYRHENDMPNLPGVEDYLISFGSIS